MARKRSHHRRSHHHRRHGKGGGGAVIVLPFALGIGLTIAAVNNVNESTGVWDNTSIGLLSAGIIFLICATGITCFILYILAKACSECLTKCLRDPVVQAYCGPAINSTDAWYQRQIHTVRTNCPCCNRLLPPPPPPVVVVVNNPTVVNPSPEEPTILPIVVTNPINAGSTTTSITSDSSSSNVGTPTISTMDPLPTTVAPASIIVIVPNILNTLNNNNNNDTINGLPKTINNENNTVVPSLLLPPPPFLPPPSLPVSIEILPPAPYSITTTPIPTTIDNNNVTIDIQVTNTTTSTVPPNFPPFPPSAPSIRNINLPLSSPIVVPSAPDLVPLNPLETQQIDQILSAQSNVQTSINRLESLMVLLPPVTPDIANQDVYKELLATMEAPLESSLQSIVIDVQNYVNKLRSIPYDCIQKGLQNKTIQSIGSLRTELITAAKTVHDHFLSVWDNDSANYYRQCLTLLSEYENEFIMYCS